jgi:hypothetical protein
LNTVQKEQNLHTYPFHYAITSSTRQWNWHWSSRHNKSDAHKLANEGEQISSKNYAISIGRQAQSFELSFTTEVGSGKVGSATHPEEPSTKDHSSFAVTRFAGTLVLVLTANECLPLLISLFFTESFVTALEDVLAATVFRKRQTTAQSSVFDVGYRVLHALWAFSTRNRAAEACEGALLMMLTASALESTSHTYSQQRELVLNNFQFYKYKATNV